MPASLNRSVRGFIAAAFVVMPVLAGDWNRQLAIDYLESRQKEWFEWKPAEAPDSPCVSCHTGLPYLLMRGSAASSNGASNNGEGSASPYERGLVNGLRSRLLSAEPKSMFPRNVNEPGKSQAAGVEAVIAAVVLSALSPQDAPRALDRMWSLQLRGGPARGAWNWFALDLDPWEMPDSAYYGATLAAVATAGAPKAYREKPDVRERISELIGYLQREKSAQPLHNRLMLAWASANLPGALSKSSRKEIIEETWSRQQKDGGWTIEALGPWKKRDTAPIAEGSNAYATAFAAFTLQRAGVPASDRRMVRACEWLRSRQDLESGSWAADSMNKKYRAGTMPASFMRDAATAYAILALGSQAGK